MYITEQYHEMTIEYLSLFISWVDSFFQLHHLLFSYYESSFFLCVLFPDSTEGNHFLLAHIPRMNETHDLGSPFKVVITISHSSLIDSS